MSVMIQLACLPFLFELHLKNLLVEQDQIHHPPVDLNHRVYTRDYTRIDYLLGLLFEDLFCPCIFKGHNPGFFANTLEAKVKLLAKYSLTNSDEQTVLEDILQALRRIETRHREKGGLNFERDGIWCWRELCVSVCYLSGKHLLSSRDHLLNALEASGYVYISSNVLEHGILLNRWPFGGQ
jgi:hypothetical protein